MGKMQKWNLKTFLPNIAKAIYTYFATAWDKAWKIPKHRLFFSIFFLTIVCTTLTTLSSKFIAIYFPDRPFVNDLMFNITPYIPFTRKIADYLPTIMVFTTIFLVIIPHAEDLDYYLNTYALVIFIRSLTILLTPMGHSWAPYIDSIDVQVLAQWDTNGFFFSGHVAILVMNVLYSMRLKSTLVTSGFTLACIVGIITQILSRSHYSIDIYAAVVTSLLVYILVTPRRIKENSLFYIWMNRAEQLKVKYNDADKNPLT